MSARIGIFPTSFSISSSVSTHDPDAIRSKSNIGSTWPEEALQSWQRGQHTNDIIADPLAPDQ